MQLFEGKLRPVQFASRIVVDPEKNYAPIEGEALAIIFALRNF